MFANLSKLCVLAQFCDEKTNTSALWWCPEILFIFARSEASVMTEIIECMQAAACNCGQIALTHSQLCKIGTHCVDVMAIW